MTDNCSHGENCLDALVCLPLYLPHLKPNAMIDSSHPVHGIPIQKKKTLKKEKKTLKKEKFDAIQQLSLYIL